MFALTNVFQLGGADHHQWRHKICLTLRKTLRSRHLYPRLLMCLATIRTFRTSPYLCNGHNLFHVMGPGTYNWLRLTYRWRKLRVLTAKLKLNLGSFGQVNNLHILRKCVSRVWILVKNKESSKIEPWLGQVVSMIAFYSDDLTLESCWSLQFLMKNLCLKRKKINKKRPGFVN